MRSVKTSPRYKADSTNCPSGASGNNGQIQCITDNVDSGRTVSYAYDALYRLTSATTNGSANYVKWGLTWTYDRYGNASAETQTYDSPAHFSVGVDATTNRISGDCYDANGNLLAESAPPCPAPSYVYDAENRLTAYSTSAAYTYDGNNLRVQKSSGGTTTVYIFSGSKVIAEYSGTSAPYPLAREYIYSGGALLAKIESGAATYYHPDHLSNRLVTDSSGNVVAQMGHYPFGEMWYNASSDKLLFTSYERDAESGNDYAMARSYISRLARFSSPDLLAGSIGNPQSLNRYTYAGNDPLNTVDPSGLTPRLYQPPPDLQSWAFEMFIEGSDPNSGLDLNPMTTSGEDPENFDEPGAIFDIFPPGSLPSGIGPNPGPLVGSLKQPKSPFLVFLENMSQDCIDALNQVGLLGIVDAMANSLQIYDVSAIAGQLAQTYLDGLAGANETVGTFFAGMLYNQAQTFVNVPMPGIYVSGGAGRFDGGDNMYWLLHEASHLAYPKGPQLDVSLAGLLHVPYTDGSGGASQSLSNYFNNHCKP